MLSAQNPVALSRLKTRHNRGKSEYIRILSQSSHGPNPLAIFKSRHWAAKILPIAIPSSRLPDLPRVGWIRLDCSDLSDAPDWWDQSDDSGDGLQGMFYPSGRQDRKST